MSTLVTWDSLGVRTKPKACRLCPMAAVGHGFCQDEKGSTPTLAFVLDMPSGSDVKERRPWSGEEGEKWEKAFLTDLGHTREEVLFSHVIRCRQPNDRYGFPLYPSDPLRRKAELNCRHYDTSLLSFDPNVFVITVHPRSIRLIGAYHRQIRQDIGKAFDLVAKGFRPAVLFGEAAELYYPYMKGGGGIKNWRGHYYFGESPFKGDTYESIFKS